MDIQVKAQGNASFIVSESNGYRSRDAGTVDATAAALVPGTVMGKIVTGGASVVADAGNTGGGTLTLDATTPVLAGAQVGDYTATCIVAAAAGGTFRVENPDGFVLGDVDVGVAFADKIAFTINDGTPDFAVGDLFTVTVAAGSGNFVRHDPAANDGSQIEAGVLYEGVSLGEVVSRTIVVRDDEVRGSDLTYAAGADAAQITASDAALAALGIIVRR
ncbi:head decoration protein [Marinobacter alexandrii]|uniref:head decoration protein n=1 Tax=Marinobacter alexandrii TaxID=2570351 RepID=UPI001FFF423C|nr:head decoration protein [Marinobacter alexandrii]MCK2149525.1 head decoration protein [Marinobacter alexandrii]